MPAVPKSKSLRSATSEVYAAAASMRAPLFIVPPLRSGSAVVRSLLGTVARWKGVVILNYHRIGDGRRSLFDRGLWSATREDFDAQVRWLKAEFDVISPRDLPAVKRGRHAMITFDDGYADNYTDAFSVLKANATPGTFFVATGFIDQPHLPWWDEIAWMVRTSKRSDIALPDYMPARVVLDEPEREQAVRTLLRIYKKLAGDRTAAYLNAVGEATGSGRASADVVDVRALWMNWDMLREMHAAGMTIGGHTVNHPVLSRLTRAEQEAEIVECDRRIRDELHAPMHAFAYPVGAPDAFNPATRECLRRVGVQAAFSYYGGYRRLTQCDDFDIPRIAVEQETTLADFKAAVMCPWMST